MARTGNPLLVDQSHEHELLYEIACASLRDPNGELLQAIPGARVMGRTALVAKLLRRKLVSRRAEWVFEGEFGPQLTVWRYAITDAGLDYLQKHPYQGKVPLEAPGCPKAAEHRRMQEA